MHCVHDAYFSEGAGDISQGEELLAAAFTGGFTAFVTTPLGLVKTKLMIQVSSQLYCALDCIRLSFSLVIRVHLGVSTQDFLMLLAGTYLWG